MSLEEAALALPTCSYNPSNPAVELLPGEFADQGQRYVGAVLKFRATCYDIASRAVPCGSLGLPDPYFLYPGTFASILVPAASTVYWIDGPVLLDPFTASASSPVYYLEIPAAGLNAPNVQELLVRVSTDCLLNNGSIAQNYPIHQAHFPSFPAQFTTKRPPTGPIPATARQAIALDANRVQLNWRDNTPPGAAFNEDGFRILIKGGQFTQWTQLAIALANTNTRTIPGLLPLTEYQFDVVAFSSSGERATPEVFKPKTKTLNVVTGDVEVRGSPSTDPPPLCLTPTGQPKKANLEGLLDLNGNKLVDKAGALNGFPNTPIGNYPVFDLIDTSQFPGPNWRLTPGNGYGMSPAGQANAIVTGTWLDPACSPTPLFVSVHVQISGSTASIRRLYAGDYGTNGVEGTNVALGTSEFSLAAASYDPATKKIFGVVRGIVRYTESVQPGQNSRPAKSYANDVQFSFNATLTDDRIP